MLTNPDGSFGCRSVARTIYTLTIHSSGVLGGRLSSTRGGMGALGSPGNGYTLKEPCN